MLKRAWKTIDVRAEPVANFVLKYTQKISPMFRLNNTLKNYVYHSWSYNTTIYEILSTNNALLYSKICFLNPHANFLYKM